MTDDMTDAWSERKKKAERDGEVEWEAVKGEEMEGWGGGGGKGGEGMGRRKGSGRGRGRENLESGGKEEDMTKVGRGRRDPEAPEGSGRHMRFHPPGSELKGGQS